VKELPLAAREPIASDALTDEQAQTLEVLHQHEADLRAAFNQLLREKGLDLELVQFQLAKGQRASPSEPIVPEVMGEKMLTPEPIGPDPTLPQPPPGGCYCCASGGCYCC
jgi:hypothetical protein